MTLQSSGTIRWSEIRNEFGANVAGTGVSLGRYRNNSSSFSNKNVGTLTDLPLDIGVPKSGTIKASDFYSKRLNMVLNMYDGSIDYHVNCRTLYNNNNTVNVVGGYRSKPSNTSNTRVIVNINKTFGSESSGAPTNRVAVRSGTWGTDCDLEFEIGSNGKIYGGGGNGGNGGSANGSGGSSGTNGSSALGIEYSCTINNLGRIQSGYGGGGGGGGRREYRRSGKKGGRWVGSSGGGGGGGAGFPTSIGGDSPSDAYGGGSNGSDGGGGSIQSSGSGGGGGASAGAGGDGSTVNNSATSGFSGSNNGGSGGSNGYAIITTQGSLPSISGNAVIGRTQTSGSIS